MDLKSTYNKIAEDWNKNHSGDTWWHGGAEKFISFLKPVASILDAGCGSGHESKYFFEKGFQVTGVDFSEEMIEIAKREVPEGRFLVADIRNLPGLKEKFDGIFSKAVLLHIPKKEAKEVIDELRDSLRQDGYLYLAVKEMQPDGKEEEIKREDDYGYPYERFFSYYTIDELKEYLEDSGMQVCYTQVTPAGKTRWIEVISKKL